MIKPGDFENIFHQLPINHDSEIPSPPLPPPNPQNNNQNQENIQELNAGPGQNNNIEEHQSQEAQNQNINSENHSNVLRECFWNLLLSHLGGVFFISIFVFQAHFSFVFVFIFLQDVYDLYLICPKALLSS